MKESKRILHVFGGMTRGGAETMVMNLYRTIERTKMQFDFIVHTEDKCAYDDEINSLGGRIYRIPRYRGKNHLQYNKAWCVFFQEHPEYKIIHGHVRSTASIYLKVANKYGLTTIIHSHSTSSGKGISALVKNILQLPLHNIADYLFACSIQSGEWLFGNKSCKRSNFMVVNNAIDLAKFSFNECTRNKIRKELKLDGMFVVGHVGRLHPAKNHDFLLEIFKVLHDKVNNSILLIVGDGELRSDIQEKIELLKLTQSVILTGNRTDVPELLMAMDVFVLPSLWEGLPLTIVEAQASGLPCFISDTITDEVCITPYIRFISLSKTAREWTDNIISAEKIDRTSIKHYIEESDFDIRVAVKKLTTFYENIEKEGKQ